MEQQLTPVLGLGWDVGGWLGKKQAVAAVTWSGTEPKWRESSACFSIQDLDENGASLLDFIRLAWRGAPIDALEQYRVVVAIDAPLDFPTAFRDLLASDMPFDKKPLSASFDKLGNVATVAMWHARHWAEQPNVRIAPQQPADDADHTIIEVYPALAKPSRLSACHSPLGALMPKDVTPGTDQYDAAICAVLALSYGMAGTEPALPRMIGPDDIPNGISSDDLATEGWIYYIEKDWLTSAEQAASRIQPS
jgi:hypothetical protein